MNPAQSSSPRTLYQRIGGYDRIASVVADLFTAIRADPRFRRFGTGRSLDSSRRSTQLLVDQLCALSGGPAFYIGRDMKTSHAGLGITEEEWQINLQYTSDILKKNGIQDPEHSELLELFTRYKDDIVEPG